jgi:hypothetical protein
MTRSEVYSWRLSPRLKADLEEAARARHNSVAELLEAITRDWLERSRDLGATEDERQQRLHQAALKAVGSLQGGNPGRAESARTEVRSRIARRHVK